MLSKFSDHILHWRSSLSCQFSEDFIFASWVFSVRKKGIWKEKKKFLRCKFASWKAADGFRRCFKAVIALGTWHLHGVTFRPKYIGFRGVTFLLSLLNSRVSHFDVKIQIFEEGVFWLKRYVEPCFRLFDNLILKNKLFDQNWSFVLQNI